MGLRINTNIQSLKAQRNLGVVQNRQSSALNKLSSGSRINMAADDAAGLAISEKLKASIRGSQQATRNAGDGISLIQTAEGGLNEISSILIRLRELSVQAASDTIGDAERKFSNLEFKNLTQEVDRIASSTQFNGKNLIDGSGESMDIQIGMMNNPDFDRLTYSPSDTDAKLEALGLDGASVITKADAQGNLDNIDVAINHLNGNRANLGALQNRLQSTISNLEVQTENLAAANSRIRDTDIAQASAELTKTNILSNAGISVLGQANNAGSMALKLIG
ncbi:MAG: flagellin FliC [Bacteriovoracaceae bacterium]|nr:flagellin FliC [Bacteriovoracaceae bacterium]